MAIKKKIAKLADKIANARPADDLPDGAADDTPDISDAPPMAEGWDGGSGGDEDSNDLGLPINCPVLALGKRGRTFYYLNPLRELVSLTDREHTQTTLPALFSPKDFLLEEYWPRRKEVTIRKKNADGTYVTHTEWITTGFDVSLCFRNLMRACSRAGVWKSLSHVRGLGGWLDPLSGHILYHCGNVLWRLDDDGQVIEDAPGRKGELVYPGDYPMMRPYDLPVEGGDDGPAMELLTLYASWNMERKLLDPMFLLGQDICSFIGGAIDWRPMVFVTGDMAQGKSTLLKVRRWLHGPDGVIVAANASEPSLAQQIGMSCLPVNLDETESDPDSNHNQNVLKLARLASSGDLRLRWSPDGVSGMTRALSCFSFSAIISPILQAQDRRRMAIVRLGDLPPGSKGLQLDQGYFTDMGRKLKRRIADQWQRWPAVQNKMRDMLIKAGHTSSSLEQYSTLMTASWLVLYDHDPAAEHLDEFQREFSAGTFRELADTKSNAQSCLDELCQAQPEVFKGGARKSVAEIVRDIIEWRVHDDDYGGFGTEEEGTKAARECLAATGLAFVTQRDRRNYLAVPYAHRMVAKIFEASQWKGAAGTTGGWVEALSRLPGTIMNKTARVSGRATKCVLVPIDLVLGEPATVTINANGEVN